MYVLKLLLVTQVLSDIQRNGDGYRAEFSVVNKGRLYNTLLHYENLDFKECLIDCILFSNCKTFNYHPESKTCELADKGFDRYKADVDSPGWFNYGTLSKVDGGFTEWRSNGPCSATCGYEGKQMQTRECTNPKPKNGGAECVGEKARIGPCRDPCPMVGCEGSTLKLSCPDGKKIKIISASYGRSDSTTCPHKRPSTMQKTDCHASSSKTVMTSACDGKSSCSVNAISSTFGGDPCGGTYKYLSVRHECKNKKNEF